MALGQFKRPAAPASATAGKPASAATKSRFAGIKPDAPKDPMALPGTYRFKVLSHGEESSPKNGLTSFRAKLEVVEALEGAQQQVGDVVFLLFMTAGSGMQRGFERLRAFVEATLDISSESDETIAEACDAACDGTTGVLVGQFVDCVVTLGQEIVRDGVGTGDHWREYRWAPAKD